MTKWNLIVVCLALAACGKSESGEGDKTSGNKAAEVAKSDNKAAPDKAAAGGPLSLDKLGLKADVPAGSNVEDAVIGEGVMITGPGLVVTIEEAGEAVTLEQAKEDASMYTPANLKEEKLADGWLLAFENTGSAGTNYWVKVRREIGGKTYACETTASDKAQQDNALAACKSLKK